MSVIVSLFYGLGDISLIVQTIKKFSTNPLKNSAKSHLKIKSKYSKIDYGERVKL